MNLDHKHVTVIGAGVAGLTAADLLAGWGARVSLIEKTPFLGGHAIQLNCKATDACVKCGACLAEDKLKHVTQHGRVAIYTGTQIDSISGGSPYDLAYRSHSPLVNADRCDGCGVCFQKCPVPGAILQGRAPRVGPYVAIRRDLCRYFDNKACTLCRDACPKGAIRLADEAQSGRIEAEAILIATGFAPHHPTDKPYGYGRFPNVITSLDAERLLRDQPQIRRPSDGGSVKRIAFIQCVGSRDARLGHLWCAKICCGSSLRMARLIQSRQPETQISVFYIDVQTFGKDFETVFPTLLDNVSLIRAIPADIGIKDVGQDQLEVFYFDPRAKAASQAEFDLVVLSVGLSPLADNPHLAGMLGWSVDANGFMPGHDDPDQPAPAGIFTAGAATGPMSIAESVSSAEKAVFDLVRHLTGHRSSPNMRGGAAR